MFSEGSHIHFISQHDAAHFKLLVGIDSSYLKSLKHAS